MKILSFTFIIGVIFLYFMNMAMLKTAIPNMEWIIHAGTRFLLGFFVMGVSCFYAKSLRFKNALKLILVIVILDYFYDYYIEAYRLNFQIILHGIYMLVWGALMGYLAASLRANKG
ncbi:hypothetical protein [Methylomonas methanica]|uniref:Uncharacterized protein n=1 Tax=Methylomonas methanica TaxID=421 RepID=A0A177M6S8_METMH|nr:hypothetical protein [Methylomonas methanica]OAI01341.1 hypothetical protein A1332_17935 [Methylomonas methanica]